MARHYCLPQIPELEAASWLTVPNRFFSWKNRGFKPAPMFRREFVYSRKNKDAVKLVVSAGGYYEIHLNGRKVTESVLSPTPTNFDKRVFYRVIDITALLLDGANCVTVMLGNSIYNCDAKGVWMQDTIIWRDYPRFILQISDGSGEPLLVSDALWDFYADGPVRVDSIRNGEIYDARREVGGWMLPAFDASGWSKACKGHAPGGLLVSENHPPCIVYDTLPMKAVSESIYDSGQNLAGWTRIKVRGEAGAEIKIRHAERLDASGAFYTGRSFVDSGEYQTDIYTLKGDGIEEWEPRFAYHGFRYAEVIIAGNAALLGIEARAVGTGFMETGKIRCGNEDIMKITDMVRWSYRSNFVGFPTDCPTREKQGWTGDALCAVDTGLYLYDSAGAYEDWVDSIADTQRPSGQIAAKSPISSSGYNWGFGPAWDAALILIPEAVYAFTGRDASIRKNYVHMQKYLDFCADMVTDNIAVGFGLGDWCYPGKESGEAPAELVSTAFYYRCLKTVAFFAELLGKKEDSFYYSRLAGEVRTAFLSAFCRDGVNFAKNDFTSLALPVAFGLAPQPDKTVAILNEEIRRNNFKSMFGIIGAKYAPWVLADYGYADTAVRMLLQEEYPGYVNIIRRGGTTLWETWDGSDGISLNHVMFGDVTAWLFRYVGGFRFSPEKPGKLRLQPVVTALSDGFSATFRGITSHWERRSGKFFYEVTNLSGHPVELTFSDGSIESVPQGVSRYDITD